MNLRYVAITLLIAGATTSFTALACRPLFRGTSNGFIGGGYVQEGATGKQRLPANAKGVLFFRSWPSTYSMRHPAFASTHILTGFFSLLDPAGFSIVDTVSGKRLKARLTRLDVSNGSPRPSARIFLAQGQRLSACIEENLYSLDGCAEVDRNPAALIANGSLLDVTTRARKAHGLFRVEPVGGFARGRSYLVRYRGTDAGWAYPKAIEVSIDANPVTLLTMSPPHLEQTPHPKSIASTARLGLTYRIPADMERYRASMHFFTQDSTPAGFQPAAEQVASDDCGGWQGDVLGGDPIPGAYPINTRACLVVQGRAGLLEAENLVPTKPVRVNCAVR